MSEGKITYRIRPGSRRSRAVDGEMVSTPTTNILALADGKQVGKAQLMRNYKGKDIFRKFEVLGEHRKKGIGRELLRRLMEHADKEGIEQIYTRANPYQDEPVDREKLMKLYSEFGFEPTGQDAEEMAGGGYPIGKGPGAMIRKKPSELEDITYGLENYPELRPTPERIKALREAGLDDMAGIMESGHGVLSRPERIKQLKAALKKHGIDPEHDWTKKPATQEEIYEKVRSLLPEDAVHASGGLPDVRGTSDVDIAMIRDEHAGLEGTFPEGTTADTREDRTIYSIPGYDRPVNVYVGRDKARVERSVQHRKNELMLAMQYPELARQAAELKAGGMGTEEAWAQVLGLEGDPYDAMLDAAKLEEQAKLKKTASSKERMKSFLLSGSVQGVGVRKTIHGKLDELGEPGIAVNDARTGKVLVTVPEKSYDEIIDAVKTRLKEKGKEPPTIEPSRARPLKEVRLTADDLRAMMKGQGFTIMQQEPDPIATAKGWASPRFRLTEEDGELVGQLPALARKQLAGKEPIYASQMDPFNKYGPTKFHKKVADLKEILQDAELIGSRGRAKRYGRPEPAGRDYDYLIVEDDAKRRQAIKDKLREFAEGSPGFRYKDRPNLGGGTATSEGMDISVYGSGQWDRINRAWPLLEAGLPKEEVWPKMDEMTDEEAQAWLQEHLSKQAAENLGAPNNFTALFKVAAVLNKLAEDPHPALKKWITKAEGFEGAARRRKDAQGKVEEHKTVGTGHYLSPANKKKLEKLWGTKRYNEIAGGASITEQEDKSAVDQHLRDVVTSQLDTWNKNWRRLNPMLQQWLKTHTYSLGGNISQFKQGSNAVNAMAYNPNKDNAKRLWEAFWNSKFRKQTGTRMNKMKPLYDAGVRASLVGAKK